MVSVRTFMVILPPAALLRPSTPHHPRPDGKHRYYSPCGLKRGRDAERLVGVCVCVSVRILLICKTPRAWVGRAILGKII
nr:uncharacterized protein CTRU02_02137 [Colletotrichum truncatum]KAF6799266.1 hypothetical protein CTRU02_02137 [Colletotrichum truncatum]